MKKGEVDSSIRDLLGALIKWAVMGFGIVIACNQLGIPIVAMLTGVSIIGLAVGFAAQETLANFIAGIVIFLDKPLRVGDWVEADGTFGQVRRVTFRSTRLLTMDGEVVVIPNTQLLSSKLVNHSTNPINRVNIPIGIAYKASIDDARRTLLALTATDNRIVKQPAPEVVVKECADSSVNLLLRFWIEDEAIERKIGYEYIEKAKKALDAANIEIPFPHMQLFVESTPAVEALARPRAA
jgi:small conductance mechanosensitive channel